MPTVNPSPLGPKPQYELASGLPAVGYQLFFYVAGTVGTKQNTYTNSSGAVANPNPIVLNALGQPSNEIWFQAGVAYKIVMAPDTDSDPPTSPIWSMDALSGMNDVIGFSDEWIASNIPPTFIDATHFTLPGDQTVNFQVGRRLKTINSGGAIYSTISASVFGSSLTTITVANDAGALDSGLSAVSYGIISAQHTSLPAQGVGTFLPLVGGTLSGALVLSGVSGALSLNGTIVGHMRFNDNTYDIGASGMDRPRDLFLSRTLTASSNGLFGGTVTANDINTNIVTSGSIAGGMVATQAEVETGTTINKVVTPGRQQFHPSAAKGWAKIQTDGALLAQRNVSGITVNGPGDITVYWGTPFSNEHYAVVASMVSDEDLRATVANSTFGSGTTRILVRNASGVLVHPNYYLIVAYGDQ
jgi:hypothetical protein